MGSADCHICATRIPNFPIETIKCRIVSKRIGIEDFEYASDGRCDLVLSMRNAFTMLLRFSFDSYDSVSKHSIDSNDFELGYTMYTKKFDFTWIKELPLSKQPFHPQNPIYTNNS